MTIRKALIVNQSRTTTAISQSMLEIMDIDFDTVTSEQEAWELIKAGEKHFDLILVSRSAFGKSMGLFVAHVRGLSKYSSVPLILLISDKGEDSGLQSLYSAGFTQIFSLKEFDLLEDYIQQFHRRNTLSASKQNKVVILEDDLGQQMVVQAILEDKQCECYCFESAEDALEQVKRIQPDLIVSDFFLKGKMTGLEFVLSVRVDQHPWQQIPILCMTAQDDSARKSELVRSGANDYIAKPIDPIDLALRAENLIRYKHLLDTVKQQKEEMRHLAMHDQLTGLYNRHFVNEQVHIGIQEAKRHQQHYALIVVDVDHFKRINDQYGHDIGDQVLVDVANLLKRDSRPSDVVARMGGEEFLLLLSHCDLNEAVNKAERIRRDLSELEPLGLTVTASFGVAELNAARDTFEKLFKAADVAVYQAKQQGRNRVEVVSETELKSTNAG